MKLLIVAGFSFVLTMQAGSATKPKPRQTTVSSHPPAAKITGKTAKPTAHGPTTKAAASKSGTAHSRGRSRYAKARTAPGPSYQTHPDPQRYQEIQNALAAQGFYKGQADGQWNADSVEALKAFQSQHGIDPDGKINARSLIGLGLGPKHDSTASVPLSAVDSAPPPTATDQVQNSSDEP